MKLNHNFRRSTMIAGIILGISACSSKPDIKDFPRSASADQEIMNLEAALRNSREDDLDVLAPVSFNEARESLDEAKDMKEDDRNDRAVLDEVALGRAYLSRAESNAKKNRRGLEDVLEARASAIEAKAPSLMKDDFAYMEKRLKEEMTLLEEDEDSGIKTDKRGDFVTGYMDIELRAIKENYLGETKRIIERSEKNGARDLTPTTYKEAQKRYAEADRFITKNRDETDDIKMHSEAALTAARKLDRTLTAARKIQSNSPEKAALRMQAQSERMNKTSSALRNERETSMALAASNTELSKEQQLQSNYEKAREKFSGNEAEVYKQGDQLVIRLRSLEFPKSEAVLTGDNFGLLKKVDDVIASFEKSNVIIEGHTDSTGSKQLNQKLSNERAEAVKQYLEANTADQVANFEARGYGFDKPLASNKTPEGRAQNRRVDVIIQPKDL